MKNYIQLYKFDLAPQHLQALSQNRGDEDWIAIVPDHRDYDFVSILDSSLFDSMYEPQKYQTMIDGYSYIVWIGSHA